MLDTNQIFFNNEIKLIFVEPYPERLLAGIQKEDQIELYKDIVQNVDKNIFDLQPNDFLFIDSSHVSKVGSDVNYLLFEILPLLPPGVIIHFHDIFHEFEYPEAWILEGRYWTENYLLKAFLAYNFGYEIILFNSELNRLEFPLTSMPLYDLNHGGSLYIRKLI